MISEKKKERMTLIPIGLILIIVPLICHYETYKTNLENCDWQAIDRAYDVDIFLLSKSIAICIIAAIMLALFLMMKQYKQGMKIETYPLLMYVLLVSFSALCSPYKYFALHGAQDMFESVFTLLSYVIIAIFCMYTIDQEKMIRKAVEFILIGASLIALIGILQMLKIDPLRTSIVQMLITLGSGQSSLTFNQPVGRVYATLFNPNYIGAYTGIMCPIALCTGFALKNKVAKMASVLLSAALLIITFGAGAKNGVIVLGIIALLLCIIYRQTILQNIKIVGVLIVVFILLLVGVDLVSDHRVTGTLQGVYNAFASESSPATRTLQNIITDDDEIELVLENDILHVKYEMLNDEMVTFDLKDQNGTDISYDVDESKIAIQDDRFSNIELEPRMLDDDVCAFTVYVDELQWTFTNQVNDGTYYFLDWANKYVKLEKADSAVFTNHPFWFSGRGYIWAKTIPLLKKYIFLGAGPDSFQMVFPQYDYVDLSYEFAPNMLITRAHNMYLQMAIHTGVLSLICFLVFYGIYFVKSVKIYILHKQLIDEDPYLFHIGVGIFCGTIGYMISGLVNDSLPVTAPLYWAVVGIGIAINSFIGKKYKLFTVEEETDDEVNTLTRVKVESSKSKKKQSRKQRKQQL